MFTNTMRHQISVFIESKWLLAGSVLFGLMVRISRYFHNRALWFDESSLSLSIAYKSFHELFSGLRGIQMAPLGYVLLSRVFVLLLGNNEYALRLIPLLSGCLALIIFIPLARQVLEDNKAVLLGVVFFACGKFLIHYSVDAKPYSSDVLFTGLILLATIRIYRKGLTLPWFLLFLSASLAGVLISFPACFVIGGAGGVLCIYLAIRRKWTAFSLIAGVCVLAAVIFVLHYHFFIQSNSMTKQKTLDYWVNSFAPFPPLKGSDFVWYLRTVKDYFSAPGGFKTSIFVIMLTFFAGFCSIFKRNKWMFAFLVSPPLLALAASMFHAYPFRHRLILFTVPVFLLFTAEGALFIARRLWQSWSVAAVCFIGLLTIHPFLVSAEYIVRFIPCEEIREPMAYLEQQYQPGDTVYVYYGAKPATLYYTPRYNLDPESISMGNRPMSLEDIEQEMDNYTGTSRFWFLYTHELTLNEIPEVKFMLYYLNKIGEEKAKYTNSTAGVYLYNLSP